MGHSSGRLVLLNFEMIVCFSKMNKNNFFKKIKFAEETGRGTGPNR
jgi:hypothetical protein